MASVVCLVFCLKICAGILILVSAITVGIIDNNKDLDHIRDQRNVQSHLKQAKKLINLSLATATWLIVLNIIVVLWEVVYAIIPVVLPRSSTLQRFSVVLHIMVSNITQYNTYKKAITNSIEYIVFVCSL